MTEVHEGGGTRILPVDLWHGFSSPVSPWRSHRGSRQGEEWEWARREGGCSEQLWPRSACVSDVSRALCVQTRTPCMHVHALASPLVRTLTGRLTAHKNTDCTKLLHNLSQRIHHKNEMLMRWSENTTALYGHCEVIACASSFLNCIAPLVF